MMSQRIKYDGEPNGGQWLLYKYPLEEFSLGTELEVHDNQQAMFYKDGELQDLLRPGIHYLSKESIPLLDQLIQFSLGERETFFAEIYFINKTVNLGLKWGTSTQIPLEDPKYGLILNVGARGGYGIEIYDSRLFVSRMIGAIPKGSLANPVMITRYFNGVINSVIKSIIAEYMVKKQISFLEISMYLMELSALFKEKLDEEFAQFGISLTNFYCEAITPGKEDYERLRRRKEEIALGIDFYQQNRTFDIIEKIVENSSSENMADVLRVFRDIK